MVYTYPDYMVWICIVVALIAAIAAVKLWPTRHRQLAIMASVVSLYVGLLLAPALAMDRVLLNDERLQQRTGFWFSPTTSGFRLADVDHIQISTKRGPKSRMQTVWSVNFKDGRSLQIEPSSLWERNSLEILERLRAKGIEFR